MNNSFSAEFKLFFNNKDFLKGVEEIKKAMGGLENSFLNFGSTVAKQSALASAFTSTALNSLHSLGKGITRFTNNAVKESARLHDAFIRIPRFLGVFNMGDEYKSAIDKNTVMLHKNKAMQDIHKFVKTFSNTNPNMNMSYSDIAESYGTFLSGGLSMEGAKAGIKGLSYAMKIFPEVDKDTLTSSLVNAYNQLGALEKELGNNLTSEALMDKVVNTYAMMSDSFRFDLIKGENPFKVLTKSFSKDILGKGFSIEEITALAGVVQNFGKKVANTDTAISNFIAKLPRAERRLGTKFGKSLVSVLNTLSKASSKTLTSVFGMYGVDAVATGIKHIDLLSKKIKEFQELNKKPSYFKQVAEILGGSFASSEKTFAKMTENFQSNYGRIARGFKWMGKDIASSLLLLINNAVESENSIISSLGNITTFAIGTAGMIASTFASLAPSISSIALLKQAGFFKTFSDVIPLISSGIGIALVAGAKFIAIAVGVGLAVSFLIYSFIRLSNAQWARDFAQGVWNFTKGVWEFIKFIWDGITGILSMIGDILGIADLFKLIGTSIYNFFYAIGNKIYIALKPVFDFFIDWILWLWDGIKKVWEWIKSLKYWKSGIKTQDTTAMNINNKVPTFKGGNYDASGFGRGRKGKDEYIKGLGYYMQNITARSKGVEYSLFPSDKTISLASSLAKTQSSTVDFTKGSLIDVDSDSVVQALFIIDTSIVEIKDFLKEILDIKRDEKKERENRDSGFCCFIGSNLEDELKLTY